jgi:hypothetical protein
MNAKAAYISLILLRTVEFSVFMPGTGAKEVFTRTSQFLNISQLIKNVSLIKYGQVFSLPDSLLNGFHYGNNEFCRCQHYM